MEKLHLYNYWICIGLMMIGFYGVIAKTNLVKKVICLGVFQTAIFLLYLSMAVKTGASAPISALPMPPQESIANPLPHVLMLTAIVVSVSVTAVALSIIVNIKREYGSIETDEIDAIERAE